MAPAPFGSAGLSVGEVVECRWRGKKMWYPAAVERCWRERGIGWLCDVRFDDGELERDVEMKMLRAPVALRTKKIHRHYWYEVRGKSGSSSPRRGRLRVSRRPTSGVIRAAPAHTESAAERRARCSHSAPTQTPSTRAASVRRQP